MATTTFTQIRGKGFFSTLREDNWWVYPLLVLGGLGAAVIYMTWAAFEGNNYFWSATMNPEGFGGYLSPLYSPPLFIKEGVEGAAPLWHAWLGPWPSWWPGFIPASPAFLILIFPGAFRFTCYYYRKAYYRGFTGTPPACAVGSLPRKSKKGYAGETGLMVIQNLHRYSMYFAVIFIFILTFDGIQACFNDGQFGFGVGSFVLLVNPVMLGLYTFGCHSFRHLMGGRRDCFSCDSRAKMAHGNWSWVSVLNRNHELFAWVSLVWVVGSDVYVRLVASGVITDLNTWT